MIEIKLTKNKVAVVDDCDSHLINYRWHIQSKGYARHTTWNQGKVGVAYLHHAIVGFPLNGLQIDHINGDALDNRRLNLRIVTRRQNQQNLSVHRNGKLPGIRWDNDRKKWRCHISINNKNKYLGDFQTAQEAHERYLKECGTVNKKQIAVACP
jgi:hypothetical protein